MVEGAAGAAVGSCIKGHIKRSGNKMVNNTVSASIQNVHELDKAEQTCSRDPKPEASIVLAYVGRLWIQSDQQSLSPVVKEVSLYLSRSASSLISLKAPSMV
ncbi:hypothetical protein FBU30_002193 [Linnemannia zychae]|nr:hypothetical protein FBU30_002193 [Linnemannia zychae]